MDAGTPEQRMRPPSVSLCLRGLSLNRNLYQQFSQDVPDSSESSPGLMSGLNSPQSPLWPIIGSVWWDGVFKMNHQPIIVLYTHSVPLKNISLKSVFQCPWQHLRPLISGGGQGLSNLNLLRLFMVGWELLKKQSPWSPYTNRKLPSYWLI